MIAATHKSIRPRWGSIHRDTQGRALMFALGAIARPSVGETHPNTLF